jgi:predicted O-methyltransferase YrrM
MTDQEFINILSPIEKAMAAFYLDLPFLLGTPQILEIGSGWGLFTRFCMMKSKGSFVTTIDKIAEPRSFAENTAGYEDRIKRITGDSKQIVPTLRSDSFDVVMVDGDHGYIGFKKDFEEAWRVVKDGGTIIVDDLFHEHNWDQDYGIAQGLAQAALEKRFVLNAYPYGHGIGIITVRK